jgi:hypothetical protein
MKRPDRELWDLSLNRVSQRYNLELEQRGIPYVDPESLYRECLYTTSSPPWKDSRAVLCSHCEGLHLVDSGLEDHLKGDPLGSRDVK